MSSEGLLDIQGLKEHPTVQFTNQIVSRPVIGHVTSKTFTRWAPKPMDLKNKKIERNIHRYNSRFNTVMKVVSNDAEDFQVTTKL